jgi:hypothetical protein
MVEELSETSPVTSPIYPHFVSSWGHLPQDDFSTKALVLALELSSCLSILHLLEERNWVDLLMGSVLEECLEPPRKTTIPSCPLFIVRDLAVLLKVSQWSWTGWHKNSTLSTRFWVATCVKQCRQNLKASVEWKSSNGEMAPDVVIRERKERKGWERWSN